MEVIASLKVRDQVVQLSLIPDIAICKINSKASSHRRSGETAS